jgi:hypothetical protein
MSADYFDLARRLALAEGRATLQRVAQKATAMRCRDVCACSAYRFPHRPGSGACPAPDDGYDATSAEIARLHDAAEARAINNGFN